MPSDTPFGTGGLPGLPERNVMNAFLVEHWWALMLRGVVAVLFGIIALAVPGAVLLSFALLFGIYMLIDGAIGVAGTIRAVRAHGHWGALLAEAVLNLLMGVIALAIPGAAVLAFILIMAAWALMSGVLMLMAGFNLHATHGRWWLVLGGLVSIIWGGMLLAAPVMGAVVLAWWLGVYAIVFGIALLACGWRLRGHRPA